ncbi:PI-PLC X domain-containing protein 1-like [Macrosteles quadrilineatus]|uniref:PI-PLC X domain-containing protein 1-like n=1 Tax=Macrosteles quadrilineatus TaxID=74068 RepID=UPI0023E149AD|nr:PI-PLC X domain-containing protein 1-like [Macrosteles quadrilineatus]
MELLAWSLIWLTKLSGLQSLETEPIWLTVSALYRTPVHGAALIDRELQLNWAEDVEEVALFTSDPSVNTSIAPVVHLLTEDHPEGIYQTNITLGRPNLGAWELGAPADPESPAGDQCLPFWIGSYRNGSLEQVECLKIRPTWMSDNSLSIGGLTITSLVWPGTHNSACYRRGDTLSLKDTLARYVLTQDQDVWSQLVYGIRYIDLRVGIYPTKQNRTEHIDLEKSFWVNHDLIKVRPLVPVLREIKQFLQKAKGEIVIVDFHRFPVGFAGRHPRHNRLVELLERELKDVAIEFTGTWPTLDTLWQQEKQLIITYGDNEVAKKHPWMWPPLMQMWGNQQTVDGLEEFLESCMNETNTRRKLWAAMAQLTPGQQDLLFKPTSSLRTMAEEVNPRLTEWLRDRWWSQSNIVASDFFLGNNVIDIAITANIEKGNTIKRYELM